MRSHTLSLTTIIVKFACKAIVMICLSLLAGCQGFLHSQTGRVMVNYSQSEAVPFALTMDDPLMGCALGEAFSPFLLSFERSKVDVDQVGILMNNLSGFCAQTQAWEYELQHLRAMNSRRSAHAKDARIAQMRLYELAARRQYKGYQRLVSAFGEPGEQCPALLEDEELYYLIGLINGLQAAQNNIAVNQSADVPLDVVNKVARGAACLDSEKWWGVPGAIQGAVWSMMPSNAPKNADPKAILRTSSQYGIKQGVRLSHVFEAEVYTAASDIDGLKDLIAEHAQARAQEPADARLRMLDAMAFQYIRFFSDRVWTQDTGSRTPHGKFGEFWQSPQQQPVEPVLDIDDLI